MKITKQNKTEILGENREKSIYKMAFTINEFNIYQKSVTVIRKHTFRVCIFSTRLLKATYGSCKVLPSFFSVRTGGAKVADVEVRFSFQYSKHASTTNSSLFNRALASFRVNN